MEEQVSFLLRYQAALAGGNKALAEKILKEAKAAGYEILLSAELAEK